MDEANLWAKEGGLIGLILLSLFSLIGVFIHTLSRKDKHHRDFIKEILDDERADRKEVNKDRIKTSNRLTNALHELTVAISHSEEDKNKK